MKKITILGLALFGLAAGAFAQGAINLDNSIISPGISIEYSGNYYYGTLGIEVWELNQSTSVGNINGQTVGVGYANMITDGFKLEKTFTDQTITAANAGVISLGEVNMPDVSPAGATVDLALVAWTGSGSNPLAPSFGGGNSPTFGTMGVIEFVNPTANPGVVPPPTPAPLSGWAALNEDLIMPIIPEPSVFTLASLGAAAFLLKRRKK